MTLPPGQRLIGGFPRFGTHFHRPPPAVPPEPSIEITGPLPGSLTLALAELKSLPRRELTADFHCVAGWSATDLHWEGVAFEALYRSRIEPLLEPAVSITHAVFEGLDGYRSIVWMEDALTEDVLIADRLDGRPLDSDHGAPVRLVSPRQYGFMSTKHLCRIELHTTGPATAYHPSRLTQAGLRLVKPHPRARVWEEERHRYLPGRVVRPVYARLIRPFRALSARGSRN
jgi:DMSO/TMAO reductase YedYZ molybdopterin-dependent catalytic subunit